MIVLITGIAGLIGSNFARWILDNIPDANIIGIDNLSGGTSGLSALAGTTFHELDLTNFEAVNKLIAEIGFIDYYVHAAAYAAEGLSPFLRVFNYTQNVLVSANLINNAITHGCKRFLQFSSMAVYGQSDGKLPFTEKSPMIPIDPYGIAKLSIEMDLRVAGEHHGLDWVIIRPHNVYGIGQTIFDKYRGVIGIWAYQCLSGANMTVYGDGEQQRAFTYVDDILEPLWNALTREQASKQCINLGGSDHHSINKAAEIFKLISQTNSKIVYLEKRHEVKCAFSSWEKSEKLLDFSHKTSLENGMRKFWNWTQTVKLEPQFQWTNFEIEKGLYSYWARI